jgi:single-strand DNA-binding protein
MRYFPSNNTVASFPLATTEKGYTLPNGTQVPERTEWHNLVLRGRLAEVAGQYVHKGDKLYVEGKIHSRAYDDQAGVRRYVTEIFVEQMEMLTSKAGGTATPAAPETPATPAPN